MAQLENSVRNGAPTVCAVDFDNTLIEGNLGKAVAEERMKQLHGRGEFPRNCFINPPYLAKAKKAQDKDFLEAYIKLKQAYHQNENDYLAAAKVYFKAAMMLNKKIKKIKESEVSTKDTLDFEPLTEMHVFKGMTEKELRTLTRQTIRRRPEIATVNNTVTSKIAEINADITIVVSGSPQIIVEEAIKLLGLQIEHVVGSSIGQKQDHLSGRVVRANVYHNKTQTAEEHGTPKAAIGNNTPPDKHMLESVKKGYIVVDGQISEYENNQKSH